MIVRYEAWGGWAKLENEPGLVALDRDGLRALGLDGGARWTDANDAPSAPIEVHVAVTQRCGAGCEGCYLDARPDGDHVPTERLMTELDAVAAVGAFTVAFGGGEPLTRDDLPALARHARSRGLTPVLTTSGLGLTEEKAKGLADLAQVNVSYDGEAEDYARVRGWDGARVAERAIARLVAHGVRVGVNVVLTRDTFDRLDATIARAKALGAREAQLLRYKPAGRAASLDYLARRLTPEQAAAVGPTLRDLVRRHAADGAFSIRIDCAMVPFFSADADLAARPGDLARLGVLGCEAGGALAAIRSDGKLAPCSFAAPTTLEGAAIAAHTEDAELARYRRHVAAPPEPCASCSLRAVCKGGCKVVSSFVDHAFGPDPECPRVRAHRSVRGPTERATS